MMLTLNFYLTLKRASRRLSRRLSTFLLPGLNYEKKLPLVRTVRPCSLLLWGLEDFTLPRVRMMTMLCLPGWRLKRRTYHLPGWTLQDQLLPSQWR